MKSPSHLRFQARRPGSIGAALLLLVTWFMPLQAQLSVRESFGDAGYTAGGDLHGLNGGTGFSGAWIESGSSTDYDKIQAGSLTYGSLGGSGNSGHSLAPDSLWTISTRSVSPIQAAEGTTLWASYLFRKDANGSGTAAADYFGLTLYDTLTDGVFFGDPGESVNFALSTAGKPSQPTEISSTPVALGSTAFLVAKIQFMSGNDTIELFVNPDPSGGAPTVPNASKTDLNLGNIVAIGFLGGPDATWSFDEIRLADSFTALVPEPPSTAWVFSLLTLLIATQFRRLRGR